MFYCVKWTTIERKIKKKAMNLTYVTPKSKIDTLSKPSFERRSKHILRTIETSVKAAKSDTFLLQKVERDKRVTI